MAARNLPRRRGWLTSANAAMLLIAVLLLVQMYVLVATLESYLAGHREVALPGAVVSGVLFAACAALLGLVTRMERARRVT